MTSSDAPLTISPSGLYNLLRPTRCDLREWLRSHGYEEEPRSALTESLLQAGIEHERRHLLRFPDAVDLAERGDDDWTERTRRELERHERVIYQGELRATAPLGGRPVEVVGHPDFMLPARRGWAIRDSKLGKSITDYVRAQILLYGWLYEQTTGEPPVALHIHSGSGEIHDVPYEDPEWALGLLRELVEVRLAGDPPPDRVGTAKCNGCGFRPHCWPQALERKEVGTLPRVDRGLVEELFDRGIETAGQLIDEFDERSLARLERPWRNRREPVGELASRVLATARAHVEERPVLLARPEPPGAEQVVAFDLEGVPARYDAEERIYLWGMQVFGAGAGPFRPAVADFGRDGDRAGWDRFLTEADRIFSDHGDIPWVHWATYERVKIDLYVHRFGDPRGTAGRVKRNLVDLLPITVESVAVPVTSYGLKQIETLTGYQRRLPVYGGDWSVAKYFEAVASSDEQHRAVVMGELLDYNREDLEATWAVVRWLRDLAREADETAQV